MRKLIFLSVLVLPMLSLAQNHGFPFGKVTVSELNMKVYEKDTTAEAVILDEFGEAFIDSDGAHNLIFEHHYKIKILKKGGLDRANFSIPLFRYSNSGLDILREVKASSFFVEGDGQIKESKLDNKNIYTEHYENADVKKFAVPNVSVGCIVEISYRLEKGNLFNFKKWDFQSDIPKIRSEYWALIPANYVYNISLKGFLKLSKNESELLKNCFQPGGGNQADCTRMKFAMENIPAFIEEEYTTTSKNYLSSINFELSEVKYFSGVIDKITKEWKDVEEELRKEQRFGLQLKRGKEIVGESVERLLNGETDPLNKAKIIYEFIVNHYTWNGEYSKYCENGIKKAFDGKTGNVGDINLSLIAAFRYAGLSADPVILSTRDNGYITELYPVLSDFNYVIARLNVNDKIYLLDATDPLLPFGMIPFRCLNGKGRMIGDRQTAWEEIGTADKFAKLSYVRLKLDDGGNWTGSVQNTYMGYEAYTKRKEILASDDLKEYEKKLDDKLNDFEVSKLEVKNLENIDEPLVETFELSTDGLTSAPSMLFNPFFVHKRDANPFKTSERLYPVDFGAATDDRTTISIEVPEAVRVVNLPDRMALGLPNNGGKYIFDARNVNNMIMISSWLMISKPVFSSEEYHYLKELFSRIVQLQNTDIIFRKS
ncbi:MAG TPA: DUF3857 domain-containing protein [Cyclobacteriaceae bacterium]|nr:DUF3857 domain-containing protein [Cyclobacteriaceae bacterium]